MPIANISMETLDACIQVIRKTGAFQLKHFRSMPAGADSAKAQREMVSFVDVESESMLREGLLPLVKSAGFYGEESGKTGSQDLVWIVDPLDGTTNYLSGVDQFSISVALVENSSPVLGVVYKPFSDELYSCMAGQGVCYNGNMAKPVAHEVPASDALFMTGFPYRSPDMTDSFFQAAARVLTMGRGIRRSGSAALDLANLSMGWIQGFWESDLQPYDVAAAVLMMRENGIRVTNERGEDYDMFTDRLLVAALPGVHGALLEVISATYGSGGAH